MLMNLYKRFRKILAGLVLIALLLPTAIQIGHNHIHFFCTAKNETHYHIHQDECPICDFEYSIFIKYDTGINFTGLCLCNTNISLYKSEIRQNDSAFSFLLRAPPSKALPNYIS